MTDLNKIFLFRMTHIANVPHILKHGITHKSSANSNPNYAPIGDSSIIRTRDLIRAPGGKRLGTYIPFYFWARMPMLFVIQNGFNNVAPTAPQDIVYCVTNITQIVALGLPFHFTDGHAVDGLTTFYTAADVGRIESIVDFAAVKRLFWKDQKDLDLKRRKEAEFLVDGDIAPTIEMRFAVYNDEALQKLLAMGVDKNKIFTRPGFYF